MASGASEAAWARDGKSVHTADPRVKYCTEHSVRPQPVQSELSAKTMAEHRASIMIGAPEALHLCANLIKLIKGKRCLDVGVFTGSSTLAWALATPEDGEVFALDVQRKDYDDFGAHFVEKAGLTKKVHFMVGPAIESLDKLIQQGEAGKFDFAFLDAMKTEYRDYYERCLTLLRPGGIIAIDNSLQGGAVYQKQAPEDGRAGTRHGQADGVRAVDALNKFIHGDERVDNSLLGIADGIHLVFKK